MKTPILVLTTLLLAVPLRAETASEKRWRLRAEILERQLELAQMELREKNESPKVEPATKDFVDAYGTRFTALDSQAAQIAYLESNEVKPPEDPAPTAKTKTKTKTKETTTTSETTTKTESPVQDVTSGPDAWPEYHKFMFGYQVLKPSTRIYFDVGSDDPGELDLFKDGNIGVSVDFLTLSWDFGLSEDLSIGVFTAGGISSSTSESDHSAIFIWSCGLALNLRDLPFAFEAGVLQGVSASEMLSDHTDTALFVGISLTKPTGKKHVIKLGNPTNAKRL